MISNGFGATTPWPSLRRRWHDAPPAARWTFGAIMALAVGIRLYHIGQPMRLDEARTFTDYAIQPIGEALSNYYVPNNHLFHTLLVWISIRLFGDAEWAVRLPAFLAGVAIVPATYLVSRTVADRMASLAAAALAAVLPGLVLYSTNARGYTIVALAFLLLILIATRLIEQPSFVRWAWYAIVIAVGTFTIPIMLYPVGGVVLWILVERLRTGGTRGVKSMLFPLFASLAAAAVLTVGAYAPVLVRLGPGALVQNPFVLPVTTSQFLSGLPSALVRGTDVILLGVPVGLLLIAAVCAVAALLVPAEERARRRTLLGAVLTWSLILLLATRHAPPARVWLFLAPLCCIYAGIGVAALGAIVARSIRMSAVLVTGAATALVVLVLSANTIIGRTVFRSDETVRVFGAADVAHFILTGLGRDDRVILYPGTGGHIDYYLFRAARRRLAEFVAPERDGRLFMVVVEPFKLGVDTIRSQFPEIDFGEYRPPVPYRRFEDTEVLEFLRKGPAAQ